MIEKEIRGYIDAGNFESVIEHFTKLFGSPKYSKRVSIALADFNNLTLETRVRITNGRAEVVQKIGDLMSVDREEVTIPLLTLTSTDLVNLYKTYKNFLQHSNNPMLVLIQHENYVFKTSRIEVKVFRQFGNEEFFAFEVEALVEMEDSELEEFCAQHNLVVETNFNHIDSIKKRNAKTNINLPDLADSELESILEQYLSK